jgi:Domain of unknown function DUF11
MVVTNNGPAGATGVTVSDPVPAGTTFVSVTTSQGSCTGGAVVNCALGSMPAGASVTITLVTTAGATGTLTNTATVVGNEAETNTSNNTATATDVVNAPPFTPPVVKPPKAKPKPVSYCTAVTVKPKQLFVGRPVILTFRVAQHGKHLAGVRVKIMGKRLGVVIGKTASNRVIVRTPTNQKGVTFTYLKKQHKWVVRYTKGHKGIVFTKPSIRNGVVTIRVYPQRAGIVTFVPLASKVCNKPRIGVTGVFTPPVTG